MEKSEDIFEELERLRDEVAQLREFHRLVKLSLARAVEHISAAGGLDTSVQGILGGIVGDLLCRIEFLTESGPTLRRRPRGRSRGG